MKSSCILRSLLAILLIGVSLQGCDVESFDDAVSRIESNSALTPPPVASGATFSDIQASVFTPSCATSTCHAGGAPAAGLNLEAANSYTMLVGIQSGQDPGFVRVLAGSPDNSYLVQ